MESRKRFSFIAFGAIIHALWPEATTIRPQGFARMRAISLVLPLLMSGIALVTGCSFNEAVQRPEYADDALYSLCDYGQPLTVRNR